MVGNQGKNATRVPIYYNQDHVIAYARALYSVTLLATLQQICTNVTLAVLILTISKSIEI